MLPTAIIPLLHLNNPLESSFGHTASQESHPALTVSCHLPIRAGPITQMGLANTASSRQSWTCFFLAQQPL